MNSLVTFCLVITSALLVLPVEPHRKHWHYHGAATFSQSRGSWCNTRVGITGRCVYFAECYSSYSITSWAPAPTLCNSGGGLPLVCCPVKKLNIRKPSISTTTHKPSPTTIRTTTTPSRRNSFEPTKNSTLVCGKAPNAPPTFTASVFGGSVVVPHSRPWMAVLGERLSDGSYKWFCGGILISQTIVLTAAHCVTSHRRLDVVRMGSHNVSSEEKSSNLQDITVTKTVIHPRFKPPAMPHDLALLHLQQPVTITDCVVPICLPILPKNNQEMTRGTLRSRNWAGLSMKVAGWGSEEYDGEMSPVLKEASVTVFPLTKCRRSYKTLLDFRRRFPGGLSESFLCAGHEGGETDACQGDSGGPLVYEGDSRGAVLAGVVAGGFGCGKSQFPGLYTNILSHMRWIKRELRKH